MPEYHIVFGAYVRMYAEHTLEAQDGDDARRRAIAEFKTGGGEFHWLDPDYDNLALPSIVGVQSTETGQDVVEGYDFAVTAADARQYAAGKMLEALEFVAMTFADIEVSKRKGYFARCPKIVAEAIAEAAAIKDQPINGDAP